MENNTFITKVDIKKVRHLKDISIPLSESGRKNLILTGKNGSGKTSVLEKASEHLNYLISRQFQSETELQDALSSTSESMSRMDSDKIDDHILRHSQLKSFLEHLDKQMMHWNTGCVLRVSSIASMREKYEQGKFILAFYKDDRKIEVSQYKNIEKVDLKDTYALDDSPSKDLGKYLVNLKTTQAFAKEKGDQEKADSIEQWFIQFENILQKIYQEEQLKLDFDIETFQFTILLPDREPFTFNTMSTGYAAVFDIIGDLIMRMEKQNSYDIEGIVLIDEIETHLHVELQRNIMPILSELFPNIQFIMSTHSPFILNSTPNAVIYDLENKILVKDGLTSFSYSGIVEGYFNADTLSNDLRSRFEKYKKLTSQKQLSSEDLIAIAELEYYLDEIPDYLNVELTEQYSKIKYEFHHEVKA